MIGELKNTQCTSSLFIHSPNSTAPATIPQHPSNHPPMTFRCLLESPSTAEFPSNRTPRPSPPCPPTGKNLSRPAEHYTGNMRNSTRTRDQSQHKHQLRVHHHTRAKQPGTFATAHRTMKSLKQIAHYKAANSSVCKYKRIAASSVVGIPHRPIRTHARTYLIQGCGTTKQTA